MDRPDDASLDFEPRHTVGDLDGLLERRRGLSRQARRELAARLDLPYGPRPSQRLDLFDAVGRPPWPVVVYLHGGSWRAGTKEASCHVAASLSSAGIAAAVMEYPLLPSVSMDELVADLRAGIAWLTRNAESLGVDADRTFVAGHSAGAHLAAMLIADGWQRELGLPADIIKGACLISGLYDLVPVRRSQRNDWTRLDARGAVRNSPIRHLPRSSADIVITVGSDDLDAFRRQARDYAAACHAAGAAVSMHTLPGRNHYETAEELHRSDSDVTRAFVRAIQRDGGDTSSRR